MSRIYTVPVRSVSISVCPQDFIGVYAGANMACEIIGFGISSVATVIAQLAFALKIMPTAVTTGSGGAAGVLDRDRTSDPASSMTARINDTVIATTSGTARYVLTDSLNVVNGYPLIFPERSRPIIRPSEAAILALIDQPAGPLVFSGWMKVRELF